MGPSKEYETTALIDAPEKHTIGAIIVTFNSADVIINCLESLLNSDYQNMKITVVDNCSTDDTIQLIRKSFERRTDYIEYSGIEALGHAGNTLPKITVINSPINSGYAGGVNIGLKYFFKDPDINLFWILNPDIEVYENTASQFELQARKTSRFGLMGGRIIFMSPEDTIQSDGGEICAWNGVCSSINAAKKASDTSEPNVADLDFISGASMIASREFIENIGFMSEDYFLYYEEVDWAFRRKNFALSFAPNAVVKHHGGTSIGSAISGGKQGSAFSNYFNYRNRMRFTWKYHPLCLPTTFLYSALKIIRLASQGYWEEAGGAGRGLLNLGPSKKIRQRLSGDAAKIAFKG